MNVFRRSIRLRSLIIIIGLAILGVVLGLTSDEREIPVTWDMEALKSSHVPPPDPSIKVEYVNKEYYDALPEHVIYKSYPVYAEDFKPEGYLDSLRKLEPEVIFDASKLESNEDWVAAGKEVFFWSANLSSPDFFKADSLYLAKTKDPITKDGIYPFYRYVIKEKGEVLLGSMACSNCHTRVTPEGDLIAGAQGNHAFDPNFGYAVEKFGIPMEVIQNGLYQLEGTPLAPDLKDLIEAETKDYLVKQLYATSHGVMTRQGMAHQRPLRVPSLIGIKDIKYLDHSGLQIHEGPGDIMRYAALNQGMDMLTSYNGFVPMGAKDFTELPTEEEWDHPFGYDRFRYTDEQLYALAMYLYSLEPPANPNQYPEEQVKRGEVVFIEQGCVTCHTPPLYTNNMLTPAIGFQPPEEHYDRYDIFNVSVETESVSTMKSRRGTGYYKIPSLKGVWYRSAFFHSGELATLEDVLDPARLEDDYVPTGYMPQNVKAKAVPGHDFGLDLNADDKAALVAFMKTL